MWFTPMATAVRSRQMDWWRSLGKPRWNAPDPVTRIAPKPMRFTATSPNCQLPEEAADGVSVTAPACHYPLGSSSSVPLSAGVELRRAALPDRFGGELSA